VSAEDVRGVEREQLVADGVPAVSLLVLALLGICVGDK
jgi:hypothetical protein